MSGERPDPTLSSPALRKRKHGRPGAVSSSSSGPRRASARHTPCFEAAGELKADGVDVVVGFVETHGRAETEALLGGLEILPPRLVPYRGTTLKEFDLDAALARRPTVILVDELAHSNAEGSRHAKRWQDVLELVDAGIDVYTALNVQHIESLNDLVAKITGVVVRETVPDSVLEARRRDRAGGSAAGRPDRTAPGRQGLRSGAGREAMKNFFRKGNLIALRELRAAADRGASGRADAGLHARSRHRQEPGRCRAYSRLRQPEPPGQPA